MTLHHIVPQLRERIATSIWFIPLVLCAICLASGLALSWADNNLSPPQWFFQQASIPVTAARQVLATIAGALLGIGGVVFSVTMVALTLTSGQYGPKLLRQYLSDSHAKISMGLFIGTSLYCLLAMSSYRVAETPGYTLSGALLLTLLSLIAFIAFIHNTATDLQADQIIQRLGRDLSQALHDLATPERPERRSRDTAAWRRRARGKSRCSIGSAQSGYVQAIDYQGILEWCVDRDYCVLLRVRAGDFLLQGSCVAAVFGRAADANADDLLEFQQRFISTGPVRTPIQDPEYPITQLNQLINRALSPGINDPGTAITCIDWYSKALSEIIDSDLPGTVFVDAQSTPRIMARLSDLRGLVRAFYAPVRQCSRENVPVLVNLLESLERLAAVTRRPDRLALIAEEGDCLLDTINRDQYVAHDQRTLNHRYRKLQRTCNR